MPDAATTTMTTAAAALKDGQTAVSPRMRATFERLRGQDRKALVVYLTAHDPDLNTSVDAAITAVEAGADVLEIGVPFSDPCADGEAIQKAMTRALGQGGGIAGALEVVQRVRARHSDVPIVLFGYLNPLLWGGFDNTCARLAEAGVDGLLVVDVPQEESGPMREQVLAAGLDWIALVAPTSGEARARAIAADATGFLYLVSMTGVTGGALDHGAAQEKLAPLVAAIRETSQVPVCTGFGVRDAATAKAAATLTDGVVVGSAVVRALEADVNQANEEGQANHPQLGGVRDLITDLREGLD